MKTLKQCHDRSDSSPVHGFLFKNSCLISGRRIARTGGFTLIELMIVMALLGVVAAVATVRFSSTVDRLHYSDYVRRIYSVFKKARTEAIVTNSTQRVVCNFSTQTIERRGQKINSSRTGYDEVVLESIEIPLKICTIERSTNMSGNNRNGNSGAGAYTFLPDGLGDSFRPLDVDIIQGESLNKELYWMVRRDSRGRVTNEGPAKVADR